MSHDTQTISRAVALLRALADAEQPLRLVDLVEITGMHKATVHRLMGGLITEGLVRRSDGRRYSLGPEAWMIGNAANSQFDLVQIVQPELKAITAATQDVALMMVRTGQTAVCMAREEGTYPLKPSSLQIGSRRPLGVGAGSLAILSGLDDETIDIILTQSGEALAEYPGYSVSKILEMVKETRRTGYAYVDGLIIPEMIAVAAPVFDLHGAAIASITCSAINSRLRGERLENACRLVLESAARLSSQPLYLKTALQGELDTQGQASGQTQGTPLESPR